MINISILGATGSVGTQTLDVIRREKDKFNLIAFSANKSYKKIIEILNEFSPKYVAVNDRNTFEKVKDYCKINGIESKIVEGIEGLVEISTLDEIELLVTSIVGMIGLVPTLAAVKSGKHIALANKETLVTGGELVMENAKKYGVKIIPVDSEHSAIYQCLRGNDNKDLNRIYLTASGGPFRNRSKKELLNITPEEAIKHPRWNMGKKISIDSSTLINKGLEVIEARWLFDVNYDDIKVLIHPESIIHSMVEYIDGSVIAQLASADMRLPIQYALNFSKRKKAVVDRLDFYKIKKLTFEEPDFNRFRGLKIAYDAGKAGGIMPTILNAANEEAVRLFLNKKIAYLQIIDIIEECLNKFENERLMDLQTILDTESKIRLFIKNKFVF